MNNSKPKVFTFKSGHQVWVKPEYNPHLVDLIVERWREENLPPVPPVRIKRVPVKDGVKELEQKDTNDPSYQALYSVWLSELQRYREDTMLQLAVDVEKIDYDVIRLAREWSKTTNYPLPTSDVQCYIQVVASTERFNEQGQPDVRGKNELDQFSTWLSSLGGPSETLVEMFSKFLAENRSNVPGKDDIGVGMSHPGPQESGRAPKTKSTGLQVANLPLGSDGS